jgi:cysteinyl-tRNA synthetase
MDDFRLYNTLTRQVEPFAPADGRTVRMYTCGPTVYNPAHLGNFRTFLFEDLLRRALRLRGWGVEQVMNLTDVDDKIIKRAAEQGRTISQVTEPVIAIFAEDRAFLRIEPAEHYPRATEFIPQMIDLVRRLEERGLAYLAEDGTVYYAIARFPGYGKLSRLDTRQIKAGARVAQDDYSKDNAQDFALWKAAKPEDEAAGAAWDSPWGRGRPGWHLECSAMAMSLLGETLDLHCGGIDLIFPHHEDEIAQSEGATGVTFARVWCHGEFLLTDGTKMAKRVGNVSNVKDLREEGISPAAIRHLMFSTHYRQQLNLTGEQLEASMKATLRLAEFWDRLREARSGPPALATAADELSRRIREALFDDLNAPQAMAALFEFVRAANAELDRGGEDGGVAAVARARGAVRGERGARHPTGAGRHPGGRGGRRGGACRDGGGGAAGAHRLGGGADRGTPGGAGAS